MNTVESVNVAAVDNNIVTFNNLSSTSNIYDAELHMRHTMDVIFSVVDLLQSYGREHCACMPTLLLYSHEVLDLLSPSHKLAP